MTREPTPSPQDIAAAGAQAWEAVLDQLPAEPVDHTVIYAVLGDVEATIRHLGGTAQILRQQIAGYADSQPAGIEVYDADGTDPHQAMATAATLLDQLQSRLRSASSTTSAAWSVMSSIGVRKTTPAPYSEPRPHPDENQGADA